MAVKAYELKEDLAEGFVGGSVAYGPRGKTFDLAAALEEGNGTIVTDDEQVQLALDGHDALKTASVPEGYSPPAEDDLSKLSKAELVARAEAAGVGDPASLTKAALVEALTPEEATA